MPRDTRHAGRLRGHGAKIGFVSLGGPKALTDSELILTQPRAEGSSRTTPRRKNMHKTR